VVTGSSGNEFIKVASSNSIGKAVNGNGGNDVIDGGVGSTFVTGGENHNTTFFLDGRAPGTSWSTITDFRTGVDKATIWGFVKGVSSVDTSFANFNSEGAGGYQGLTLHFKNLLPSGQTSGSNANLNSITLTGRTLQEFGASSLNELNKQINDGSNSHFIVGATNDSLGTHGYLQIV
jgi:serralysin